VDSKTLFWLFVGMIIGTYLLKEVGVDVLQLTVDCLNNVLAYIQNHASKQGVV
jgi:hypothetical protein|tara:strand:+ start:605 stop:763 length:159 start_codon:yes stop_codon:yes gene_type:complete